ncbi:hypothetical protein EMCG_04723 [[Emmonsia] crescens]|uniref:Uncharacterized protein n=1 Tax=[Emmonsia] crescens TaxID=73230 RepID=A0A0G2HR79_9EURO|nr:hypothetical protein EMCG_04723 [Emmonsia crescens UAMH 3008]
MSSCAILKMDSPFIVTEELQKPHHILQNAQHSAAHNIKNSPVPSATESSANDDDSLDSYIDCPQGCGEIISTAELSSHLDLHMAEGMTFEEAGSAVCKNESLEPEEGDNANTDYIYHDIERPYAHKKQMPSWLRNMLEEGAKVTVSNQIQPDGTLRRVEFVANETSHLIPVLAQLCELDETI